MSLPGDEIWRFEAGSTSGYEAANAVAADADGNFYVAGITSDSLDGLTANVGGFDLAVTKISSVDGSVLWTWQDGAVGDDYLSGAAVTSDGGVVVAGNSNGTYNGVASEGSTDFVAIKLDADGAVEWTWQEGSAESDSMNSCSTTADGNVVVTGATLGDWEGGISGTANIVAVKLDATDGTVIWRYQAGVAPNNVASYVSTARADGSVVLAGASDGDWDGGPVGVNNFAAVALDEDGVELWRYQGGVAAANSQASGVAALDDGSVVLAGQTSGQIAGATLNAGGLDFAVIKLSEAGVQEWAWQDGTENDDLFSGAAAGLDGTSVIFSGYTYGSWVEQQAGDEEYTDFASMSLDADGTSLWTYQAGTPGRNEFRDVAVRSTDGAALLVGWTHDDWAEDGTTNFYSEKAGVLIATEGAAPVTPAPSASPTPAPVAPVSTSASEAVAPVSTSAPEAVSPVSAPSSCGATASFQVTSAEFPAIDGCYQSTEASFSTGGSFEVWTVSGNTNVGQNAVLGTADDSTGDVVDSPWNVLYYGAEGEDHIGYCVSVENAATVHPSDATWTCDLDRTSVYVPVTDATISVECGCLPTPPPTPVPTPAPTPEPDNPVSRGEVIGASAGGAAALLLGIVLAVVVCRRRRRAENDESFGSYPRGPEGAPVAAGGGGVSGGEGAVAPPPPPPPYSEPSPLKAGVAYPAGGLPPPPAYSETPAY